MHVYMCVCTSKVLGGGGGGGFFFGEKTPPPPPPPPLFKKPCICTITHTHTHTHLYTHYINKPSLHIRRNSESKLPVSPYIKKYISNLVYVFSA